ncbi:hypothetical protein [Piscirickettsia litoralis]|uniref:Uncharacterized protein n=1 Tax=Piscirickettsia litoralis TaxID=1891921 RepID=A0ABX3A5K1_9GAMM|nr:hypothetical protein [Piscirickettsia litoralis]ODN41384.1 hypothetical protein BGC07_16580 [Piscirickettsia litoralis]
MSGFIAKNNQGQAVARMEFSAADLTRTCALLRKIEGGIKRLNLEASDQCILHLIAADFDQAAYELNQINKSRC